MKPAAGPLFIFAFQDLHLHSGTPPPTGTTSCWFYTVPLFCFESSSLRCDREFSLRSGTWFVFGVYCVLMLSHKPQSQDHTAWVKHYFRHDYHWALNISLNTVQRFQAVQPVYQCRSFYHFGGIEYSFFGYKSATLMSNLIKQWMTSQLLL